MEVVEKEAGHQAIGVGRYPGQGIFDQGAAIFAEVDGVHACHGRVLHFIRARKYWHEN